MHAHQEWEAAGQEWKIYFSKKNKLWNPARNRGRLLIEINWRVLFVYSAIMPVPSPLRQAVQSVLQILSGENQVEIQYPKITLTISFASWSVLCVTKISFYRWYKPSHVLTCTSARDSSYHPPTISGYICYSASITDKHYAPEQCATSVFSCKTFK